jgi:hypothetical protein
MISGQLSSTSFTFRSIVRNSDYIDIVSVSETYQRRHEVELGAGLSDIISELPVTLNATDSNDQDIVLNGQWASSDYNSSKPGTYSITFIPSNKPEKLLDSFSYFKVRIVVLASNEPLPPIDTGGLQTWHIILMAIGGVLTLGIVPLVFILRKKGSIRQKPVNKNKKG